MKKAMKVQKKKKPTSRIPAKITRKEAKEALLRAGYLLEYRIESLLRSRGYYVEANSADPDPLTGKSRELDVFAIGAQHAGKDDFDYIFRFFHIECINNPQPLVLITKKQAESILYFGDIKIAGIPLAVIDPQETDKWIPVQTFLDIHKYHHYWQGRIATQYCSFLFKKDKKEWMALHDDEHFSSLHALTASLEYRRRKYYESFVSTSKPSEKHINLELYYPVLVVQNELLEGRPTAKSIRLIKADHLQYRMTVIRNKKEIDYRIDVVTEKYFSKYLSLIEAEIEETARRMTKSYDIFQRAKANIAKDLMGVKTPEDIQHALEHLNYYVE